MPTLVVVLIGVGVLVAVALALTVKNLLYLCQPSEVLIFSGRKDKHAPATTGSSRAAARCSAR